MNRFSRKVAWHCEFDKESNDMITIKKSFMLPTIIFVILRYYRRNHPGSVSRVKKKILHNGKEIIFLVLFITMGVIAFAQVKELQYNIKRNGSIIGTLRYAQHSSGSTTIMKMESEIRTRLLFNFNALAKEETTYENGVMTWSSIYRKLNGREKANQQTQAAGNRYIITRNDKTEIQVNYPISYNMLCMYTMEPLFVSKVYSDNFRQFLEIRRIGINQYRVLFPDGNYSEYFYTNGICSKLVVHHTLYSATIELTM